MLVIIHLTVVRFLSAYCEVVNYNNLKIIKTIQSSEFVKNLATLISGTAIAQLIAIGIQPVIRRMYTPDDFGAFAVYISIVGIVAVISSLRYEQAIILPKSDDSAKNLVVLSIFLTIVISLLTFITISLFSKTIINLLRFPIEYKHWLYLLPVSIILLGSYQSMNFWLIRKKTFRASSINKVARRSSEATAQSLFGVAKKPFGLVIGDILGNLANIISGVLQLKKNDFSFNNVSKKGILKQVKIYNEFPKFNLIPVLLNALSLSLPVILINKYFAQEITGYFDLSRQILIVPIALIAKSYSQVLFQKITEMRNEKRTIFRGIVKQFIFLLSIGIIGIIIIQLFGIPLFKFIFGNQWEQSGIYAKILVFSFAVRFAITPFSIVLISLEKLRIQAAWQLIYFLAILSLLFLKDKSFIAFLTAYVIIDIICYSLNLILVLYASYKHDKKLVK